MDQKQLILYSSILLIGVILLTSTPALLSNGSHQAFAVRDSSRTGDTIPLGGESSRGSSTGGTSENTNNLLSSISSKQCDQSLWDHVWSPERLRVVSPCITATGTIDSIEKQTDGDFHVGLRPDPQFEGLLNAASMKGMSGNINVEPICMQEKIKESEAKQSCGNFFQNIIVPPEGSHVRVTGAFVIDEGAGGWTEIHPVTSIVPIPQIGLTESLER
jgi:hypothetical protein